MGDPDFLPPRAEQDAVLATLTELVRTGGHEHLTLAPIVLPTARFFPDAWNGGRGSLGMLLRRLFIYADLSQWQVQVSLIDRKDAIGAFAPAGPGSAVWFDHREGQTVHFMARPDALGEPSTLVASAARAVAEAWRHIHGLSNRDARAEQQACDMTCVYLGFGALLADTALRHGAQRRDDLRLERTVRRVGITAPQTVCFALAVVLTVRRVGEADIKAIGKHLQPNPRAFLRASLHAMTGEADALRERVAVPPAESWGEPPDIEELAGIRLHPDDDEAAAAMDEPPPPDRGVVGMNEGRPVFRVERSKAMRWGRLLALPTVMLGMLAGRMPQMGLELPMWQVMLTAAGLGLLGVGAGRFVQDRRCSEPKCGQPLSPDAKVCPRCGGEIVGVIGHAKERLAAEEAYAAKPRDTTAIQPAGVASSER